jgi:membrane associated rhomboid family serine protease
MIPLRDTIPSRQAPVVTWALIFVNVLVFLTRSMPAEKAKELAARFSTGTWTHDYPITVEEAQRLGLNVRSDIDADVLQLMTLYPQPIRRQPTVEYLPGQRHAPPKREAS